MKLRILASLSLLLASSHAHAFLGDLVFLPPHANYQRLETEHFKVVYPKALENEANQSAFYLEDAHAVLTKAFQYSPNHKCTIILTDNDDFANGVTSAVGLQGIVLYMTLPDPYTSIGEYDHWLRNLIIHEYTHYITLEQTSGVFKLGRYLLGNLLFPNHLWPTWIAEGMAVYGETAFTHEGRGHGAYYTTLTRDGIFRGTLGTKKFLDFDQLSGTVPDYPFGESPYYAGYGIITEMIRRHGADAPARFAEESSWRVPFLNNGTLENISRDESADSFAKLWKGWIENETQHMKPELDWVRKNGSGDPRFLTPPGVSALGTRLSPDKSKVAFILQSGHERPSVQIMDVKTQKTTKIADAIAGGSLSWSSDGSRLYFSSADYQGPYAFYSDLFEAKNGKVRRITDGERAKDPGYCESGTNSFLVYSTQRGRLSELRAIDLTTKKIRTLYRAPEHHHISNPRCSIDGKTVYFAEHGTDPLDAMYSMATLGETKPKHLFGGAAEKFGALFAEPTSDGLYFTRVTTDGFYDLARWQKANSKITVVARSSGGYWTPSGDAETMAVSYVSSTGIRAALIEPRKLETVLASAIEKAPLAPKIELAAPTQPAGKVEMKHSSYNLLTSLQPRIWAPYLAIGGSQNQIGAAILGWDDVDQLEYTLTAWYDTIPKHPEGVFATYHRLGGFKLGLAASSQVSDYATFGSGIRIFNEERKGTLSLARPFPGAFASFTPALIAEWARTYRGGDFSSFAFSPDERLGLNLLYSNKQSYAYSVLPERGFSAFAQGRRFFSTSYGAWKGYASWDQLFAFYPLHSSLNLTATIAVAPKPIFEIPESTVKVGGRGTVSDLDPPLRGYPLGNFYTRQAAVVQASYRVPLAQIFRGFGTFPLFMKNFGAYGFYDGAKLQNQNSDGYTRIISGAGAGLIVNTQVGYAYPLQLKLEYAHGFQKSLNGEDTVSFNVYY